MTAQTTARAAALWTAATIGGLLTIPVLVLAAIVLPGPNGNFDADLGAPPEPGSPRVERERDSGREALGHLTDPLTTELEDEVGVDPTRTDLDWCVTGSQDWSAVSDGYELRCAQTAVVGLAPTDRTPAQARRAVADALLAQGWERRGDDPWSTEVVEVYRHPDDTQIVAQVTVAEPSVTGRRLSTADLPVAKETSTDPWTYGPSALREGDPDVVLDTFDAKTRVAVLVVVERDYFRD